MGNDSAELERLRVEVLALRAENERLSRSAAAPSDSEFLQTLLRALPAFVARLDPELNMSFLNRLAPGFELEDVLGTSFLNFIDPAHHETALSAVERVKKSGGVERYRVTAQGAHKSRTHYETIVAPVAEADGRVGFVLVSFDITEQVERAEELQAKEEQLRLAVEATGIGLWSYDVATNQVEWSERMRQLVGHSEPLAPDRYATIVHPDDRDRVEQSIRAVLAGDETGWTRHRVIRPDGEVRWLLPMGRVTLDDEGNPVRITGGNLDVTVLHDLETRLRQAEKMEALGTLTTGVAHNLNNLLAVILPTLDLLQENVDTAGLELLNDALRATLRASKVVRQLMVFAGKRQTAKAATVEFGKLVEDAVALSRRSMPSPLVLELVNQAPGALVSCDPDGFSEVVTNLIVNARDALVQAQTASPRIEVRIEMAEPTSSPESGSRRVRLTVGDNGPGMPETVRQRVFDPFFTTKGPQSGTGLGLAISWSMVRAASGTMRCESSPGAGARFIVDLPLAAPYVEQRQSSAAPDRDRARLRVLLVDDDDAVRRTTRLSLLRGKHSVAEAASGAEALEVAGKERFDVVLLDQALPDCLGSEIVGDLGARVGSAKILLFTGQDVDDQVIPGVEGVLHKPLRTKELLDVLAKLGASDRASPAS